MPGKNNKPVRAKEGQSTLPLKGEVVLSLIKAESGLALPGSPKRGERTLVVPFRSIEYVEETGEDPTQPSPTLVHLKSGREIMVATSALGTPSSTIMTRLRVPFSSTSAIATETWNRERRSNRPSGSSPVAASANGRSRGETLAHFAAILAFSCFMDA